ncbi:MAG: RNase J family beta-CASP ribonuclease [archaeon]
MLEITAVGGYSEIGKNMTCLRYNDEAVILDMGVHLENYIQLKGDDDLELFSCKELIRAKAIPDDKCIKDIRKKVIAIIPSHAHLDHIGAIPFMAEKYDCPIYCTPYTGAVLKAIIADKKKNISNDIVILKNNSKLRLSENLTLEFINITHSVPDAALVVIHTPEGSVVYSNDFKLDNSPTFGDKPNYKRMKELKDVKILIIDSLYAGYHRKTPSEAIAKEMLKEVMLGTDSKGKAVIVTTFSSHIARLRSIIEFGKKMNRKIIMVGRSLAKYVGAAESIGLVNFSKDAEICKYARQIKKRLSQIEKERGKYLIIATGHQGEPDAVLSKIANGDLRFNLHPEDHVIFSCTIIPSETNEKNRMNLENDLKAHRVRIFKDIHQSGHASREDHREFIKILSPEHIMPSHCGIEKAKEMYDLALELGYSQDHIHLMEDGKKAVF